LADMQQVMCHPRGEHISGADLPEGCESHIPIPLTSLARDAHLATSAPRWLSPFLLRKKHKHALG
jgi:hypothetical protein